MILKSSKSTAYSKTALAIARAVSILIDFLVAD